MAVSRQPLAEGIRSRADGFLTRRCPHVAKPPGEIDRRHRHDMSLAQRFFAGARFLRVMLSEMPALVAF